MAYEKKHETKLGAKYFYCFVDFGKSLDDLPEVYIVPNDVVATTIATAHAAWLATPGKDGRERKDSDFRRFRKEYANVFKEANPYPSGWLDSYKNNWSALGLAPEEGVS